MIAVFGASVTQQKDGYAYRLKEELNEHVEIFGFGGNHINNAGICFIDNVLESKPLYCFIDWFSTDYIDTNQKTIQYIDTIIHKFSINNCKLIFLFFPRKDDLGREKFYNFCKSYLTKKEIFYIDLTSKIKKDKVKKSLRDIVHTSEYGSTLYSKIISNEFKEKKNKILLLNTTPTKYQNIKTIKVEKEFTKQVLLKGNCEIIGFYLTVGPFSGIVKIGFKENLKKYNTWDKWCHFPRKHFSLPLIIKGEEKIIISQEDFDTSTSKRPYDYTKEKKKLTIHKIFYIGDTLSITNINEGKRINKIQVFFTLNKARIKRYKNNFLQTIIFSKKDI